MSFDYKKEYKEFYLPKNKPNLIEIPSMNFIAVRGTGNPNEMGGDYQEAIQTLYSIAFTIKMSNKAGYFPYVVPPLEGFWWMEGEEGIDYTKKENFSWISLIRLPEFVTKEVFNWAIEEATKKKGKDFSKAEFLTYEEGLCVQCMHIGSYDKEPETIELMHEFIQEKHCKIDISQSRFHHEIYLGDPRRTVKEKLRTVLRIPIVRK